MRLEESVEEDAPLVSSGHRRSSGASRHDGPGTAACRGLAGLASPRNESKDDVLVDTHNGDSAAQQIPSASDDAEGGLQRVLSVRKAGLEWRNLQLLHQSTTKMLQEHGRTLSENTDDAVCPDYRLLHTADTLYSPWQVRVLLAMLVTVNHTLAAMCTAELGDTPIHAAAAAAAFLSGIIATFGLLKTQSVVRAPSDGFAEPFEQNPIRAGKSLISKDKKKNLDRAHGAATVVAFLVVLRGAYLITSAVQTVVSNSATLRTSGRATTTLGWLVDALSGLEYVLFGPLVICCWPLALYVSCTLIDDYVEDVLVKLDRVTLSDGDQWFATVQRPILHLALRYLPALSKSFSYAVFSLVVGNWCLALHFLLMFGMERGTYGGAAAGVQSCFFTSLGFAGLFPVAQMGTLCNTVMSHLNIRRMKSLSSREGTPPQRLNDHDTIYALETSLKQLHNGSTRMGFILSIGGFKTVVDMADLWRAFTVIAGVLSPLLIYVSEARMMTLAELTPDELIRACGSIRGVD